MVAMSLTEPPTHQLVKLYSSGDPPVSLPAPAALASCILVVDTCHQHTQLFFFLMKVYLRSDPHAHIAGTLPATPCKVQASNR